MDRLRTMESNIQPSSADPSLIARIDAIEEKLKNGTVVKTEEKKTEPLKEEKKKVSAKLYNPIPESELNGGNPIVILAKKWDKLSGTICSQAGHLKAFLTNRPITIDADGIILLFKREEEFSKNLALQYKSDLARLFKKVSGSNFIIKSAYEDELEDHIIDYWSLPASNTPSPSDENTQSVENADPLDAIAQNFSDIVEMSDDSEFIGYQSENDNFEQSEFDEHESEEFLEQNEISVPDEE